ncbi:MAG: aminotransferase class V-fold PLP-dependent enzyme, partial [Lachnospiraceae bacterium]|nr:aminotransferase class V-fold PLP-dependent enzyme [Lachnospiraceae bacterium]
RNGLDLRPRLYGGTGRNSAQVEYSAADDDYEYEVGTQNGPGIAALCAGTEYILSRGVNAIAEKEREQMRILYDALGSISNVKLYGCFEKNAGPVLSFVIDEMAPSDVAYILKTGYDVTVRTGLHCAPLIHDAIGSGERGTVRISISDMTQNAELEDFINIISEIAEAGRQI